VAGVEREVEPQGADAPPADGVESNIIITAWRRLAPAETGRLKGSKRGVTRDSTSVESIVAEPLVVGRKAKGDSGDEGIRGTVVVVGVLREKVSLIGTSLAVEVADGRARALRCGGGTRWEVDVGDGGLDERRMGCDSFDGAGAAFY
jgi:hypothetical protein